MQNTAERKDGLWLYHYADCGVSGEADLPLPHHEVCLSSAARGHGKKVGTSLLVLSLDVLEKNRPIIVHWLRT